MLLCRPGHHRLRELNSSTLTYVSIYASHRYPEPGTLCCVLRRAFFWLGDTGPPSTYLHLRLGATYRHESAFLTIEAPRPDSRLQNHAPSGQVAGHGTSRSLTRTYLCWPPFKSKFVLQSSHARRKSVAFPGVISFLLGPYGDKGGVQRVVFSSVGLAST